MSGTRYIITGDAVMRQVARGATWRNIDEKPADAVFANMADSINTELLPPGVRVFRKVNEYTQVVMECPPAINRLRFAESEYAGRAGQDEHRLCAQPYRVIQAHYKGDEMIGARMFYRPDPLYTMDDVLYHANLPNINCNGYHNTAVGWVCFYKDGRPVKTWSEKIHRLLERCSGSEGYNPNMAHIDGRKFYRDAGSPVWRHRIPDWERKSEKEGVGFVLKRDAWLPVLVKDKENQLQHHPNGKPLTLEMALTGITPMAYGDHGKLPAVHKEAPAPSDLLTRVNLAYGGAAVR